MYMYIGNTIYQAGEKKRPGLAIVTVTQQMPYEIPRINSRLLRSNCFWLVVKVLCLSRAVIIIIIIIIYATNKLRLVAPALAAASSEESSTLIRDE